MAFKTLEQRFNEKVNQLYAGATLKFDNGKRSTGTFDEPFIVRKVGDGYFGAASRALGRFLPVASAVEDVKRVTLFTFNSRGLVFLAKQYLLQRGNTFENTRLLNPAFVVAAAATPGAGNIVRVRRHWDLSEPMLTKTDPYSPALLLKWKNGMLQQATSDAVRARYEVSANPTNPTPTFSKQLASSFTNIYKSPKNATENVGENGGQRDWKYTRPELEKNKYILTTEYKYKSGSTNPLNITNYTGPYTGSSNPIDAQKYRPTISNPNSPTNTDPVYTLKSSSTTSRPTLTTLASGSVIENTAYKNIPISEFPVKLDPTAPIPRKKIAEIITPQRENYIAKNTRIANQGPRRLSYISDPGNITSPTDANRLDAYKNLPTTLDDDPIIVSIGMGNDDPVLFRAFIKDLNQSVSPEYKSSQYIGRIEKFVSYVSVQRTLSFKLEVLSSSPNELDGTWKRINFLTGLAYPYGYNRGILQPNIVRLTLGNLYINQPGYITNLSTTFNETAESWDIDRKVPIAASIAMQFTLIEKRTVTANSPLYGITETISGFTQQSAQAITNPTT